MHKVHSVDISDSCRYGRFWHRFQGNNERKWMFIEGGILTNRFNVDPLTCYCIGNAGYDPRFVVNREAQIPRYWFA